MSLTQEIIALEQNRQSIVDAVNAKGGELAENAPLNAIAPAIEALPSGSVACLEGEITLASEDQYMYISCDLPKMPIYVSVEIVDALPITSYKAYQGYVNISWDGKYIGNVRGSTDGTSATFRTGSFLTGTTSQLRMWTGNAQRMWLAAVAYKYKIYYEI